MPWQKVLQKVGRFDAQATQVGQSDTPAFAVQLGNAPEQPLYADEIAAGMALCQFHQKRSIAAAQFNFQRLRRCKKLCESQRFDDGTQFDDEVRFAFHQNLLGALVNPGANQANLVRRELFCLFSLGHEVIRIIAHVRNGQNQVAMRAIAHGDDLAVFAAFESAS